ncbi:MAG: hypothetical protein DMF94_33370 [Acidobacteria bacterium]|nr:MAG: hypothetical protein DMF96_24935 [Acidobacteriota bacterium]PYR14984.1 MAG: hypothetical protein DMF94_33370 [Acidobacteriota bacterium]
MAHKSPANPERSFGISVGGVLCAIAIVLLWRRRIGRAEWLGAVGAVLVVLGFLRPRLLKPVSVVWWKFAVLLGRVNARVLLSIIFFLILTPIGLVWRLTGKDPLARQRRHWPGWAPHPARYKDAKHFDRMF